MIPFQISIRVSENDIDELQHVNNVVYLQWVQDIVNQHWNQLKQGYDTSNYVWVVIRHELDYLGQANLGDELSAKTWVGETAGIKSVRYVEFSKEGKVIVKAKTNWCLVDAKTLKPKRITGEILRVLALN